MFAKCQHVENKDRLLTHTGPLEGAFPPFVLGFVLIRVDFHQVVGVKWINCKLRAVQHSKTNV